MHAKDRKRIAGKCSAGGETGRRRGQPCLPKQCRQDGRLRRLLVAWVTVTPLSSFNFKEEL